MADETTGSFRFEENASEVSPPVVRALGDIADAAERLSKVNVAPKVDLGAINKAVSGLEEYEALLNRLREGKGKIATPDLVTLQQGLSGQGPAAGRVSKTPQGSYVLADQEGQAVGVTRTGNRVAQDVAQRAYEKMAQQAQQQASLQEDATRQEQQFLQATTRSATAEKKLADAKEARVAQAKKGFEPVTDRQRNAASKADEADADATRRRIAAGQVAGGTARQAGGFTFGADGTVTNNTGKLVTDYHELQRATDALSASVEREAKIARDAAAEQGKTPINQFYKGVFGAGGRKRTGGAQDVDEENPLNGLFETAGVVAKYEVLGRGLQLLTQGAVGAVASFASLDQATRELNEQLAGGGPVSDAYVSGLENVATAAGQDVTEAMQSAQRGIAAFTSAQDSASSRQAAGTDTAKAASQNAVVTGQDISGSTDDLIAIGQSYGLVASQLGDITNAVANAKESFGSNSDEVQKGLAELGDTGKEAGYSLSQLAQVIGLIQAKTGESGSAIASTLTRIISTLSNATTSTDLGTKLGLNLTGNPAQKLEELAAAYPKLTSAEKQELEATVGGAKGLRDLIPLLQGQPALQAAYTKALDDTTAGHREFEAIAGSVAGQIKIFGAEVKQLGLDLARTGILDPLILGFELLKPAVELVDKLVQAFDGLPDPIQHSVTLLLEAVVAINAIKAAQAAGVAESGIGKLIRGAGSTAGSLLGNPFRDRSNPAAEAAAARETAIAEASANVTKVRNQGLVSVGEAAAISPAAAARAEAAAEVELRAATTALAAAELTAAEEVKAASVAKAAEAETEKLTNAQAITALRGFVVGLGQATAAAVRYADQTTGSGLLSDIKGLGGYKGAHRAEEAAAGRISLGGRLAGDAEGAAGTGLYAKGALLGEGGRFAKYGQSLGAAGVAETAVPVAAVGAAIVGSVYEIVHSLSTQNTARRGSQLAGQAADQAYAGGTGDSIRAGADQLSAAADKVDKSRSGFVAFVNRDILRHGERTGAADSAFDRNAAAADQATAARLDATGSTNQGAFDLTKPTGVEDGLKILAQNGLTAKQQLDALNTALEETTKGATGAAGSLDAYQISRFGDLAGGKAQATVTDLLNTDTESGKGGFFSGSSELYGAAENLKKQFNGKTSTGENRLQAYTEQLSKAYADNLNTVGVAPGEKPSQTQLKQLQDLGKKSSVEIAKQVGIKLSGDAQQQAIQLQVLQEAGTSGVSQAFNVDAFNRGQKIAKADIPAALAAAPQLAQQAQQDAQTNASLGLGPDGRKLDLATGKPGFLPDSSVLAQQAKDQKTRDAIDQQGAAVTGDKAQIAELNRLRSSLVKSGASKQQLAEFDQQYNDIKLKLQQDTLTNLQSLGALAEAQVSEFDKGGQIAAQLKLLQQEAKITTDPQAKRALQVQQIQAANQQKDQQVADAASATTSRVDPRDTVGQAAAAATNAANNLANIRSRGGKGQALTDAVTANAQAQLSMLQAVTADSNAAAVAALPVGDKIGEAFAAADALVAEAQNQFGGQKLETLRQAAEARAEATITSAQAYGAQAQSRLDPRDARAGDRASLVTAQQVVDRTPKADIAARAAAVATVRDLNLKAVQDQLDYANSIRLAASDPQDTVGQAKIALQDAEGRLAAANKNEADYGQLVQSVRTKQQALASALEATALATNLAKIDPRDTVAVDKANLSGPGGIDDQLRGYKGKHSDQAYQELLLQQKQAKIQLQQDQDAYADAVSDSRVDSRDLSGEAAQKIKAAALALQHDAKNSAQYYIDLKAYNDLTLASAQTAQDIANSALEASVAPGDAIGEAKAQITEATAALALALPGQADYYDKVKALRVAQFAYAAAQEDADNVTRQLGSDTTDPVANAASATAAAAEKLRDDQKLGAGQATIDSDTLALRNNENSQQKTAFEQQLQDAQTNLSLHRISGAAYLKYLETVRTNILATGVHTRQQLDELNEVDTAIQGANQQLSGQFNIGNITTPTVYQARKLAGDNGIDISSHLESGAGAFGAGSDPLAQAAQAAFSPLTAAINSIQTQDAVDQLSALQSVLDALGGSSAADSAGSGLASGGNSSTTTNHVTISGADLSAVKEYLGGLLGQTALSARGATAVRKVS